MNTKAKYLIKNTGILTISNFSSKILVFLLVPLYTSVLSTAEYGTYDLAISTVTLLYPILTVNIVDAVMRFAMDKKYNTYVFTKESFLKHNRRLGSKPYIKEVDKIEAMDIDYPEDFEICNAIYKEMMKK